MSSSLPAAAAAAAVGGDVALDYLPTAYSTYHQDLWTLKKQYNFEA